MSSKAQKAIALYEKLHGKLPVNLSARQMEEVVSAPEVELPAMAVRAVLDNKRARHTLAFVAMFLPSLWNIGLLVAIVLVIVLGKPLARFDMQTAGWEALWIIGLYFVLAYFLNLGLLSLTNKVAKHV
jgi:hypothetical protein